MEYMVRSPAETQDLAEKLGRQLQPGDVVALSGPMGAGKTAFCGGLARGLDISSPITSPTYTIVNEYRGRLALFHFDLYRLSSEDDLYDIGWEDYLARGGVCVLEWPQIAPGIMADATYHVCIRPAENGLRSITITGGTAYAHSGL